MSQHDPAGAPATRLALAFAQAVLRLHRGGLHDDADTGAAGLAGRVVERWARQVWLAAAEGHAFVIVPDAADREVLAGSPAVAERPAAVEAPLVLDGDALYLQRLWQAEDVLAECLLALDAPAPLADPEQIDAVLAGVAPSDAVDARQREAVRMALLRRLAIVTGGPGTGKTTTMARLMVAVLRLRPAARVAIAAPTGKAAARLAQALAAQLAVLDPAGQLAERLPATGTTVHRLLGLRPDGGSPMRRVLHHDLLIVDEASMLDLELARLLVQAVPANGRLVLAGDRDQLASVEAGAVFAEACASPLQAVVRLERNYRQSAAPGLAAFAGWLRDRWQAPDAAPPEMGAGVVLAGLSSPAAIAERALRAWAGAFEAISGGAPADAVIAAFDAHRVLCALRDGPLGVAALNAAIATRVRRRVAAAPAALWYTGRIVIVTRNRPEQGLFNGDVGVCLPGPDGGPMVAFGTGPGGAPRWQALRQMPAHDDAFAITVHQSQGSEFDTVALVPAPVGHPLNTRELLYTGATRARREVVVWTDAATLAEGAVRRGSRRGRLAERIAARLQAGRPQDEAGQGGAQPT